MTVYVTRNSTQIEAYHTREHCPRLEKGDRKIEKDEDDNLIQELECCNECNETVDFHRGGADGLLQKVLWLERLLGDDVDPQEFLPLSKHTLTCEDPDCVVCNDVLQQYKGVITPLYVHVESEKMRKEVGFNAEC